MTLTILTLIFNAITLVCLGLSAYYHNKVVRLYKARISHLDMSLTIANSNHKEALAAAAKYSEQIFWVRRYGVADGVFSITENKQTHHFTLSASVKPIGNIPVKRFDYDGDDAEDRAYAYRCAEELKDKLEEQI